jgi:hypothetical protein
VNRPTLAEASFSSGSPFLAASCLFFELGTLVVVVVLEVLAVLDDEIPSDGSLRRHPQRVLELDVRALDDGVRLSYVLLDALDRGAVALPQLPDGFGDDLAQIRALFDSERAVLEAARVLVRALSLVEDLEDGALLDRRLQVLGDDVFVVVVVLADGVAYSFDARPLLLGADLADGVEDPARPHRLGHLLRFAHR